MLSNLQQKSTETLIHIPSGVSNQKKKVVVQVLSMGEEEVSACSNALVEVFLMTLQSHAGFFCSALKSQFNSPLLPMLLLLNKFRQNATICLGLLRHLNRT